MHTRCREAVTPDMAWPISQAVVVQSSDRHTQVQGVASSSYTGGVVPRAQQVRMYLSMYRFGGTSTRAYMRTQARGATPQQVQRERLALAHPARPGCGMRELPEGGRRDTGWGPRLAFTRYCFTLKLYCGSISSFYCLPPTCNAYPIAILLHTHCAIYVPPPTLPLYPTQHTILVMAISCIG